MNQETIESSSTLVENLMNTAISIIENGNSYSEESIDDGVEKARLIYNCNDTVADSAKRKLKKRFGHRLDPGTMIMAEHKAWYLQRTKESEMAYTRRNQSYLLKDRKMSPNVISKMSDITDEIMDGLGDPRDKPFQRRGLVVGDVQSGKTGTYTTLCCKAVDSGYRLIILLTGTIEILRQQTQSRLDEGLVGKDSSAFINKKNIPIGVGKYKYLEFGVVTTTESDFNKAVASGMNIPVRDMKDPYIMVLKKNKNVLSNVYEWLKANTAGAEIETPLLLIDDEADNASINTSAENITVINGLIRDILRLFNKSTYVGFTATPYANIFIDSDEKDDLYPRDFIYCLSSPSNYVGPSSMYSEEGRYRYMLKTISIPDEETGLPELPYKHQKSFTMQKLPESLEEAINCFLVSCAIRDLRGQCSNHMSMMVNASRFTDVQESIKELISQQMIQINLAVSAYSHLPPNEALRDPFILGLKNAWVKNYRDVGYEWEEVQYALESAINPVTVRSINQRNGPKNLNYKDATGGLRVIAVGGNSLSRGLTLEGLCVSYFYRRSQSYDTFMQMGRWFGYREDYDDLCRVWMTQESIDWYTQVSEATDELKSEFRRMHDLKKTPSEFGFRVRDDIIGLTITARNKMRKAGDDVIIKSVNGQLLWTSRIFADKEHVINNQDTTERLLSNLNNITKPIENGFTKNKVWNNIDSDPVKRFLNTFECPDKEIVFDGEAIVRMIEKDESLARWDVALQHGDSTETVFEDLGVATNRVIRANFNPDGKNAIRFNSSALISPDNLKEGLLLDRIADGNISKEEYNREIDRLKKEYFQCVDPEKKSKYGTYDKMPNYPAVTYLNTKERRPLLLIYPLKLKYKETGDDKRDPIVKRITTDLDEANVCPIGVAIGFPRVSDPNSKKMMIAYKTTVVYQKMEGNSDLDEEEI